MEGIEIIDLDGGNTLDEDLVQFQVKRARTYLHIDRHKLLAVIENAFGDHAEFDYMVKSIVQVRRGRQEVLDKQKGGLSRAAKRRVSDRITNSGDKMSNSFTKPSSDSFSGVKVTNMQALEA